jgi:hypothetical protein
MKIKPSARRQFIVTATIALAVPYWKSANATQNPQVRGWLEYQDHPQGNKQCSNCYNWISSANPNGLGGCKLYPKDTEIAANGYCLAYSPKLS